MTRNKVFATFVGILTSSCALFAGSGDVYAGTVKAGTTASSAGGISIGGTLKPVNDPVYDYIFDVELLAGNSIASGDSFTVNKLIGVTTDSLFHTPSDFTTNIDEFDTTTPQSDVTWTYYGPDFTAGTNTLLGEFLIQTTVSYNSPPYAVGASITYSSDLGGVVNNDGVLLVSGVPEPSSVILLVLAGSIGLPAFRVHQRRSKRKFAGASVVA